MAVLCFNRLDGNGSLGPRPVTRLIGTKGQTDGTTRQFGCIAQSSPQFVVRSNSTISS